MSVADLKDAIVLLRRMPALWLTGVAGGLLGAALWVLLNLAGVFFTSRLLVIFGLILLLFITGMLAILKTEQGNAAAFMTGGVRYYFRVLLPLLVIIFADTLIFIAGVAVFTAAGITPDTNSMAVLAMVIALPTVVLTIFFDTAAVFEERRIFDAIKRSIDIVTSRFREVIVFFVVSILVSIIIIFGLLLVWEAVLYDKLQPLTTYNETQIQSFTPDQLTTIIGPSGMWVTAIVIFFGLFLLLPILISYKARVFKNLSGNVLSNQVPITQVPTTGEYDSKGRWYKY